ncbi:hypothetical protein HMPREF2533_00642 [Bacteroides fragilis]|nr:hypothetical protein HMPREF2530_00642 [Bacteroides fragilis]KXU49738.1 hypothetical protein HMPREF2533_00642 [Bacteroides fragilis]
MKCVYAKIKQTKIKNSFRVSLNLFEIVFSPQSRQSRRRPG